MIFGRYRKLHFVGIGGAGMSGMAEVLADLGYQITGSDNTLTDVTEHLQRQGIIVQNGHSAENVAEAHVVVISAAVHEDNPEVAEARRRNIPVIKRAEMLGELMRLKYSVGIAGSHGKTTSTAICGHLLRKAGVDPTVIVGGRATDASLGAKVGSGEYLVAEADEFDRSFLVMYPSVAVVTNLDVDHMDCYADLEDLKNAFAEYCNRVPFYGQIILNADDANLQDILPMLKRPVVTFALDSDADYTVSEIKLGPDGSSFALTCSGERLGELFVPLPGRHNIYNALCSVVVALEMDSPFGVIKEALREFAGVLRRFELIGESGGRLLYDDYAHHPTEVRQALEAAKAFNRPTTVIFQPHLFSRTRDFAADFAEALAIADKVILVDIYPAREKPMAGVTSKLILDAANKAGATNFTYVGAMENALPLISQTPENSLALTMGAGNVCRLTSAILEEFKRMAGGN